MRILQVVHLFVPRHRAGVEVYTDCLSAELAREHDVAVYTSEFRPGARNYDLRKERRGDVTVYEAINNRRWSTFEESYDNPHMERIFERILDEFRPDVVHLQHLLFHSLGYVRIARERGIPVIFTLHEYWLICLNGGQMILPDLTRCPLPSASDCAHCAARGAGAASGIERLGDRVIGTVKRATGVDLWPLFRGARIHTASLARRVLGGGAGAGAIDRSSPAAPEHVGLVEKRWQAVRSMLDEVDLLVAPSPFLRQMFIDFGVAEKRIICSDYGFDLSRFPAAPAPRQQRSPLRFGLVGTLVPIKGVHVAVEAFLDMPAERAELVIHGTSGHRPDYVQDLERRVRAQGSPVRFAGAFDNERIAAVLGDLDALIVPSVWYENSPLTIHEAFLARIPVLTSRLGGMNDLVTHGVDGLLFDPGDAADLRRQVDRIVDAPAWLDEVRAQSTAVKSMAENADELEEIYRRCLSGKETAA